MKKNKIVKSSTIFALATLLASPAYAVTVSWTDWNSSTSTAASGSLAVDSTSIDVSFSNTSTSWDLYQGPTNYWSGSAYTNGEVDNAPTPVDVIRLTGGGTITFNFSETILDPYFAMNSWNGNTVDFGVPIIIDSYGPGYWGNGTPTSITATGFYGSGEFHGIVKLPGSFDSVNITHTTEGWHGITVGVAGVPDTPPRDPIPEPTTMLLFGAGLAGLAAYRRRK